MFILHRYLYIMNSQYDQLPVGLIAQLVEHCTGVPEVMRLNPVQAIFFFSLSFCNCLSCKLTARIFLLFYNWTIRWKRWRPQEVTSLFFHRLTILCLCGGLYFERRCRLQIIPSKCNVCFVGLMLARVVLQFWSLTHSQDSNRKENNLFAFSVVKLSLPCTWFGVGSQSIHARVVRTECNAWNDTSLAFLFH